jgi:hypothetical protein
MALQPSLDVEHLSCLTHYQVKLYQVLYNDLYIVHDQEIYSSKTTHGNKLTLASSFCYGSISGRYNYLKEICRTLEWPSRNGRSTDLNSKNMYQLIFVAAVAATVYTNGLSFVFQ